MCGRYCFSQETFDDTLAAIARSMARRYPGQYKTGEIGPGDAAPAVIQRRGKLVAVPAVFGYSGFRENRLLLNARAETAGEKRSFAESLRERRIILPATGFFEWGREEKRTKYLFTLGDGPALYLCGLYREERGVLRFVILTRAANPTVAEIHDRMPVILGKEQVRPYLTDPEAALNLLKTASPALMHRVSA